MHASNITLAGNVEWAVVSLLSVNRLEMAQAVVTVVVEWGIDRQSRPLIGTL